MTAALGANKTKYDAGGSGDNVILAGQYQNPIYCIMDQYEAAALADASTIAVANLPKEAKIVDIVVYFDALGSSTTISIGDALSAGRYIAATATTSAGVMRMNLADGAQYQAGTTATDNIILLTTAGATTGTIKVTVTYTLGI